MSSRKAPKRLDPRPCVVCSAAFEPYRDSQVACSRSCREKAIRRGILNPKAVSRALVCDRCGEQFEALWSGLGRKPHCLSCADLLARESQSRKNRARRVDVNPARREIHLRDLLKRRYGLTLEQYMQMLARQGGRCAICGDPPDPNGSGASSRLHVDHDHSSGENRELLCTRCNQGVGYFRDNPQLLRAAAEYVEQHRGGI